MRHCAKIVIFVGVILLSVGVTTAQEGDVNEVTSPFTEEFDFQVGQNLDLNIRLDGISWAFLRIEGGDPADWASGKTVKATVTNQLENLTDKTLSLSTIILLEDNRGRQLERFELKKIRVGFGRSIENVQKIKVDGGNLRETAKIYFFAEVD